MRLPGNNLEDNRYMSSDPEIADAYWRENGGRDCPGCGRVMSARETREQSVCNDCLSSAEQERQS